METKPTLWAEVDEQGRMLLPAGIAERFGLQPGARMRIDEGANDIRFHRPSTQLTKIYIEPTDFCNLDCVTCIRNVWTEELGRMTEETYACILDNVKEISPRPVLFFGGLGEPLFHPRTIDWIRQAKDIGCQVEMITNGTMLVERKTRQLIDSGLDVLWVSIDGATPESYADVRLGAALPNVIANLKLFRKIRPGGHKPHPQLGIAMVAMKRNIKDLAEILKIARRVGANRFSVSNVLPYTAELEQERLYAGTLKNIAYTPSPWLPRLNFPKMDLDETTREAFIGALNSGWSMTFAGQNLGGANDVCNFIESGSISIGWQGDVSPCLPLLHTHTSYLHGKPRLSHRHALGNIADRKLLDYWLDPEYINYRERVQRFAFAPCTYCGGCELSEANEDDCFSNPFPACGGCLWAQGVIQCP
jgi:MoaA/NifB/PqqE/SkfB family radical SAM enzyme